MRIGVNAQRLAGQRLGVGRYIEYMVRNWTPQLIEDDILQLFVREQLSADARIALGFNGRCRERLLQSRLPGLVWENTALALHQREVDVLFCPAYTLPLAWRGPSVVAVHSLNEVDEGTRSWWYDHSYAALYRHSARRASAVVVPGRITAEHVQERYQIPAARIVIVHQAADEAFCPGGTEAEHRETRVRTLGEDRPYILFVGKCSQRRNIPLLLEAFAQLKRDRRIPHKLLLVGPNHVNLPLHETARSLGVAGDVVQMDGAFASHREIVPIYRAADVFVHPSSYEGWSMTTVEALACGVPVVAVNRAGLSEVAAGHALMVDDPTAEALADAMHRVLADSQLQADLRFRARARGTAFAWSESARQVLSLLRSAVSTS